MPGFFDAHIHQRELAGLPAAGEPGTALCCSTGQDDWAAVRSLAAASPRVFPFFGLHPWRAGEAAGDWVSELESFLSGPRSGVGECGLDALKGPPLAEQVPALRTQLELAARLGRPVALHCVRAWGPLLELLRSAGPVRFLVHAYAGPAEVTRGLAALGAYFSFGPGLASARRIGMRAALAAVPRDRLLFESEGAHGSPAAGLALAHGAAERLLGLPPGGAAELSASNGAAFLRTAGGGCG